MFVLSSIIMNYFLCEIIANDYELVSRIYLRLCIYVRGAFNQECESIHKIRMNKVIEISNSS